MDNGMDRILESFKATVLGKILLNNYKIRLIVEFLFIIIILLLLLLSIILPGLKVARVFLGIIFLTFIPGYAFFSAIFPRDKSISYLEVIILSIVFSFSVMFFCTFILNYAYRINLVTVLVGLSIFSIISLSFAFIRRWVAINEWKPKTNNSSTQTSKNASFVDKSLNMAIFVSFIIVLSLMFFYIQKPNNDENFTEFYLLGATNEITQNSLEVDTGSQLDLILGIGNHGKDSTEYEIQIRDQEQIIGQISTHVLKPGEIWETPFIIMFKNPGNHRKITFYLYRKYEDIPLHELHFWANVLP